MKWIKTWYLKHKVLCMLIKTFGDDLKGTEELKSIQDKITTMRMEFAVTVGIVVLIVLIIFS